MGDPRVKGEVFKVVLGRRGDLISGPKGVGAVL